MSKYLVRVSYESVSYSQVYDFSNVCDTREAAIKWANDTLNNKSGNGNNSIKNTRIFLGELQEEYTAERTWSFQPTGISKGKAQVINGNLKGSIEI